jgi:hypothetical protein
MHHEVGYQHTSYRSCFIIWIYPIQISVGELTVLNVSMALSILLGERRFVPIFSTILDVIIFVYETFFVPIYG